MFCVVTIFISGALIRAEAVKCLMRRQVFSFLLLIFLMVQEAMTTLKMTLYHCVCFQMEDEWSVGKLFQQHSSLTFRVLGLFFVNFFLWNGQLGV